MEEYSVAAELERQSFTTRLGDALINAGFRNISYTAIAREFNARSGLPGITVHAVRKWLVGESIPTQKRLVILARWLAVSPDWLRYGGNSSLVQTASAASAALFADIERLDNVNREIVKQLVSGLIHGAKIAKRKA